MAAVGQWPDVERAVIDWLNPLLTEPVGAFYPRSSTEEAPAIPYVQVNWDTSTDDPNWNTNAGNNYAVVRITCWEDGNKRTAAKALAAKVQAACLAHNGIGAIRRIKNNGNAGLLLTRDPDTEKYLASFTVRAYVRLTAIEV
jgi:hypothetical protein